MSTLPITERTRVRRLPERGHFDRDTVYAILDAALIGHLGVLRDGIPLVTPTACWRVDDHIYFHGAPSSRTLKGAAATCCLTVTHVDGLVLARSAFHHSLNYRSVILFGEAQAVEGDEKMAALQAFVEHVSPGRWAEIRPPNDKEFRGTRVLRLAITEASAKVRTGGPVDDDEDYALPVWAGVIPLKLHKDEPIADDRLAPDVMTPPALLTGAWPRS